MVMNVVMSVVGGLQEEEIFFIVVSDEWGIEAG